ncbi:uncharacterized protein LOC128994611 [Macrosteles quadrilineatus]|uniref:uncharacterized protein LOC128994611 n=1 Tax=Macrosteles quadrilineatus TaxID=74068 RepID=UPI0023E0BA9C|nr:uncharacterized protein LOC128994611 [Macrosteles quadrilineatus]
MWWLVLVMFFGRSSSKAVSANSTVDGKYLPSTQWLISCSDDPSVKSCLKMKSLMLLEDLAQKDTPIYIFGKSMTLVKNPDVRMGGRMLPVSLEELNSSLPKDEDSREETLDNLMFLSLEKFVKSRALQIHLPDLFFWNSWNSLAEGRRKGSGFSGAGWGLALAGGMMAALGLGSIAMMSGKAMMVSMMALMLSAMAAFRKGGGGGDQAATTYEVINVPTGHGHHARRMFTVSMGRPRSLEVGVPLPGAADLVEVYRGWNTSTATPGPQVMAPDIDKEHLKTE